MALIRAASFCVVIVLAASGASAQSSGGAYYDFLMARHLEGEGDVTGALAALQRAAAADPMSASIQAEIAGFQYRRNQRDEAEKAGNAAIALDADNVEAHRVLGLIAASKAESDRTSAAQTVTYVREAIGHLEKAIAGTQGVPDPNLNYTLGRLYLATGQNDKAVQSLRRVVDQNPGSVQGRLALAQAQASSRDLRGAIATLDEIVEDEPRVAGTLAEYQQRAGLLTEAVATYTKRSSSSRTIAS
jgi:tetratricopeptide (TPR) repeat protein